jgi:uncharacterized membrane protein
MAISPGVARDAAIVVCGHALLPTVAAFVVLPVALSVSTRGADDVSQRLLEAFILSLGVRVVMQVFSAAVELCALFVVCLCATEACRHWNGRACAWLRKLVSKPSGAPQLGAGESGAEPAKPTDLRRWLDLQRVKRE